MQLSKHIFFALSLSCFSSHSYATNIDTTLFSFTTSSNLTIEDDKEKRITLYNKDGPLDPFVGIEYFKKEKTETSKNTKSDCTEEFEKLIEDGVKDSSTSKIEKSRESDRYLYTTKITTPPKNEDIDHILLQREVRSLHNSVITKSPRCRRPNTFANS